MASFAGGRPSVQVLAESRGGGGVDEAQGGDGGAAADERAAGATLSREGAARAQDPQGQGVDAAGGTLG